MTKVTVSGKGKAKGTPDIAIIEIRVQTEDKDQHKCRRANNAASEKVVATLKKVVAENDIYAVPAQVSPRYRSGFTGTKVAGYQGRNHITATLRQLDVAEPLIAEINQLDENVVQVSSFQFDLEEKDKLENVARRAAFENATNRAKIYAEEIGHQPIHGVETIEEHLSCGSSARHPSGKFGVVLRDTNDFVSLKGENETLEMGDIELTVDVRVCFQVGK